MTLADNHTGAADGSRCMVVHLPHAQSGAAVKQHKAHLLVEQRTVHAVWLYIADILALSLQLGTESKEQLETKEAELQVCQQPAWRQCQLFAALAPNLAITSCLPSHKRYVLSCSKPAGDIDLCHMI